MKNWKLLLLGACLLGIVIALAGCYSCESYHKMKGDGPVAPEGAHKVFWDKECKLVNEPVKEKPAKKKPVAATTKCGKNIVSNQYPCNACGILNINKAMPDKTSLDNKFDYKIEVVNVSDMPVIDIELTEHFGENFKYASSSPEAEVEGGKAVWKMDELDAGAKTVITVTGTPIAAGCIINCSTIMYKVPVCSATEVVEPKLMLSMICPSELTLCDPLNIKYIVKNDGSGAVENVKINQKLPAGLMTAAGSQNVMIAAGDLNPGQVKEFNMELKASKADSFATTATAVANGGLKDESGECAIVITEPVLALTKKGPKQVYLNSMVTYKVNVKNTGDAPANELVVEDQIPSTLKFVRADNGGKVDAGKIVWKFASLKPNGSKQLSAVYEAVSAGNITNRATATAHCAKAVSASAQSSIKGIPAVLLEVVDVQDPIAIGNNTTYVITATNQGSAVATNVKIVCVLEENQSYVSATGATSGTAKGSEVTFAPLARLEPKAKATWSLVAKALKPGDVRFKVIMDVDQLERPVQETESTFLYEQ